MSSPRFCLPIAMCFLLTFAVPRVSASGTVYETHGPDADACAPAPTCAVQITNHFIYSDPAIHCGGGGCQIFHECQGSVSGTQVSYDWGCSGVGGDGDSFLAGGVPVGAADYTFIAEGDCEYLSFGISATSLAVNTASVGHSWLVCVDSTGPYVA